MPRDFIVYPTRREQVGIFGLIVDALLGKKKVKSTIKRNIRRGKEVV